MNRKKGFYTTILILFFGIGSSYGQTVSDEAKRYFDRGVAAVEMAKSPADYELAIREFSQATTLAPDWPDAFYNLGLVQEKAEKFSDALASLKKYIRLAPNSADAETVKTLINKLEYKREQEDGAKKVYDMMTWSTNVLIMPHVIWTKTGEKGDKEPDWEIEHKNDFSAQFAPGKFKGSIFEMKDGTLYKKMAFIAPAKLSLRSTITGNIPVKVNGKYFEYRYPILMIRVDYYMKDGTPVYDYKNGGELSIRSEIISVDPPKVKREQTVKWPDGRTSVTEFVYDLSAKSTNVADSEKNVPTPPDINVSTAFGTLHDAAYFGRMDMARLLIDKGKDINARDENGRTPLHMAAMTGGKKEIAELLISKGADIKAKNNDGHTPLIVAFDYNNLEVFALLIAKGADVNTLYDKKGSTLLHWAVLSKPKEVAELLIAHGADINARDSVGRTPLHMTTIFGGKKEIAELLISKGADINAKNNDDLTPLQYAVKNNRIDMADLFKKLGGK